MSRSKSSSRVLDYPQPALIEPKGAGYMPLYSAIQWVATRGHSVHPDNVDEEDWRDAYRKVLAELASENVKAVGNRNGTGELMPGPLFATCRVRHFWEGYDGQLAQGAEHYLRGGVYADEDQWRRGNDDALVNRDQSGWSLIVVSKSDIQRVWPFKKAASSVAPPCDVERSFPFSAICLQVAWNPKTKCAIVRDIDELKQNASRLLRILHRQYAEDGKAALSPENHKYLSIRDLADALSLDETAVRKELSRTRKAVDLAFLQKFGVKAPAGALIEHSTIVHGYRINPHVRFVDYQQLVSGS